MNRKLIVPLVVLLILLLLLSMFANIRLIFSSQATGSRAFSVENSYVFASPLEAKANSTDKIRITVFLLDSQGRGVPNKQVILIKPADLVLSQQNSLTDAYGRAIFDLTTAVAGEYIIGASIDNTRLSESLKIKFN